MPSRWLKTRLNIVAQKYARGSLGLQDSTSKWQQMNYRSNKTMHEIVQQIHLSDRALMTSDTEGAF